MFNSGQAQVSSEELERNSAAAYQVLVDGFAPFKPVSDHPRGTELLVWSCVHGLASLLQGKGLRRVDGTQTDIGIRDALPALALRD